jgi:hypothetical protein
VIILVSESRVSSRRGGGGAHAARRKTRAVNPSKIRRELINESLSLSVDRV